MRSLRWNVWAGLAGVSFLLSPACGGSAEDGDTREETSDGGTGSGSDGSGSDGSGGDGSGGDGSGADGSGGTAAGGSPSGGAATGGSGSGGEGPGSGGESSGGQGSGGEGSGGDSSCAVVAAGPFLARRARSAGFSGTDAEYSELYSQPCVVASDCDAPCLERGGTEAFCSTHVCIDSDEDYCLPPTKWRDVQSALSVGETIADAAVTSLSLSNGDDHDLLLLDDFGFEIPQDVTIVGIVATIRKAKGTTDLVTDHLVKLLRTGQLGAQDYGTADEWPTELTDIEYGGAEDIWGEPWAHSDINDPGFGIAIGALPGGNTGRAYVDAAYMTIYYEPTCL